MNLQVTWDNNFPVFSSYLYWHQLTQGQKDAAISLGYLQSSWDDDVIPSVNPLEQVQVLSEGDGSTAETGDADESTQEQEAATEDEELLTEIESSGPAQGPFTTNAVRPVKKPKKGENEPENTVASDMEMEMAKMESEIDSLRTELKEAMDILKEHQTVLTVLQGLPDGATVSSVQEVIELGGNKREKRNRGKTQKVDDEEEEEEEEEEDEEAEGKVGKDQRIEPVTALLLGNNANAEGTPT